MISHGKEIKVFTGNSNPKLANQICNQLFFSNECILLFITV